MGVEVQDEEQGTWPQVFVNTPAWTLPQATHAAVPTMFGAACLLCPFPTWEQSFVCVWDSVFRGRDFWLDPDYAQHVGGHGRWEDGAVDGVWHAKMELLGALGWGTQPRTGIISGWRALDVCAWMSCRFLGVFCSEIFLTLSYICAEVLCTR